MATTDPHPPTVLAGLDGRNPIAALAAFGTLTALDGHPDLPGVRLHWERVDGAERPALTFTADPPSVDGLCQMLAGRVTRHDRPGVAWHHHDLQHFKFDRATYRHHLAAAITADDRDAQAHIAAIGAETPVSVNDTIRPSPLYMPPSPKPTATIAHYAQATLDAPYDWPAVLHAALFADWLNGPLTAGWNGPGRKPPPKAASSLGLDPAIRREWAYDPGKPPAKTPAATVPGAIMLALQAWPLLPTIHTDGGAATRCFPRPRGRRGTPDFVWPIWREPLTLNALRALLAHPAVYLTPPRPDRLPGFGVATVYGAVQTDHGQTKYALQALGRQR